MLLPESYGKDAFKAEKKKQHIRCNTLSESYVANLLLLVAS